MALCILDIVLTTNLTESKIFKKGLHIFGVRIVLEKRKNLIIGREESKSSAFKIKKWIDSEKSFYIEYPDSLRFYNGMEKERRFEDRRGVFTSFPGVDDEILVMFAGGIELAALDMYGETEGRKYNYVRQSLLYSDICIGSSACRVTRDRQKVLARAGFDVLLAESVGACDPESRATALVGKRPYIFDIKGIRIGLLYYSIEDKKAQNLFSEERLLKDTDTLKKSKTDFIFVLFRYRQYFKDSFEAAARAAARAGAGYIIGDNGCLRGDSYGCIKHEDREIPVVCSLGAFGAGSQTSLHKKDSIILRVKFKRTESGVEIIEESYIPCFTAVKANGVRHAILPVSSKPVRNTSPRTLKDSRRRIGECLKGLQEINSFLSLGKLFDIMEMTFPERYSSVEYRAINAICTSVEGVCPGAVYFAGVGEKGADTGSIFGRIRENVGLAMEKGAFFVISPMPLGDEIPHIVCGDPIRLYNKVYSYLIDLQKT